MAPPLKSKAEKLQRYEVSNSGCWEWTGAKDRDGYGVFGHHRSKQIRAHRASYELKFGEVKDGVLVFHSCDNPSCINPDHLFLGSPKDNTQDMMKKGRMIALRGEAHPGAKLTKQKVIEIRARRSAGEKLSVLANEFGVSFQHISDIYRRSNLWT